MHHVRLLSAPKSSVLKADTTDKEPIWNFLWQGPFTEVQYDFWSKLGLPIH